MELSEVKAMILAGKHEGWNEAVKNMILSSATPKMHISDTPVPRKISVVVAFQTTKDDWALMTQPIAKDQPLEKIARLYQESDLSVRAFRLGNGGIQFETSGGGNPELVCFPVGLMVIGGAPSGHWADEECFVHGDTLAEMFGRSHDEELHLLEQFCFDVARGQIRDEQETRRMLGGESAMN
jgi:hypothetical protein